MYYYIVKARQEQTIDITRKQVWKLHTHMVSILGIFSSGKSKLMKIESPSLKSILFDRVKAIFLVTHKLLDALAIRKSLVKSQRRLRNCFRSQV